MIKDVRPVLDRTAEAEDLDFKSAFHSNPGELLEIIKDMVALANSGGGTILVGVNDDGSPSGNDIASIMSIDPADITNKIYKHTGVHFHEFEFVAKQKHGQEICVISVQASRIPLVFTSVGNYEVGGKPKIAFAVGTIYFRHGAKSEPGNSSDLRAFLEREVEAIKDSWLEGIVKVVEAPVGSRVAILPPQSQPPGPSGVLPLRLTDDPKAPQYYAIPVDTTHPYRQKEVIEAVNKRLEGRKKISSHDVLCIRRVHEIQKKIEFCYTQNFASPLYSQQFVDWIVNKFDEDPQFFAKAKERFDQLKAEAKSK